MLYTRFKKQGWLANRLRDSILDGSLPPGAILPTREEMMDRTRFSSITVQRALDRLVEDGFVTARRGIGTRVVDHPPHLHQFALVFADPPDPFHPWSRFFAALQEAAQLNAAAARGRRFVTHFHHFGRADAPDFQRLVTDVTRHRLAGLIFPFPPYEVQHTPIVQHPGIPRVTLSAGASGMAGIGVDNESFFARAAEHMASRGRRRVAVMLSIDHHENQRMIRTHWARCGLELRPHWRIAFPFGLHRTEAAVGHMLARLAPDERPDGLVITDDNLAPGATEGLAATGVRVPEDIEVITHCNFPLPPQTAMSVRRLGFDCCELIRRALARLEEQRGGAVDPRVELIPAVFEEELSR